MSYPAMETLWNDSERTPIRWGVYLTIQPPHLDFEDAKPLKVDAVATLARVSTGSASDAINWLIDRGYLKVVSQDGRGVRTVLLKYRLPSEAAAA
ncbi:MAG: hypothetical protein JWM95_1707 [Gemmatimonadetes bacterium]|nr:hypothetical protein [Gemmatimonadota bacterium]